MPTFCAPAPTPPGMVSEHQVKRNLQEPCGIRSRLIFFSLGHSVKVGLHRLDARLLCIRRLSEKAIPQLTLLVCCEQLPLQLPSPCRWMSHNILLVSSRDTLDTVASLGYISVGKRSRYRHQKDCIAVLSSLSSNNESRSDTTTLERSCSALL